MAELGTGVATLPITVRNNQRWQAVLTLTADSVPVNLTGCTAKLQVRSKASSTDAKLTLQATEGLDITDAAGGEITIDADVSALKEGEYVYDLVITDSLGVPRTYLAGTFTVQQGVTR